ncbi:hypothetical protein EUGRSUZ_F01574 [Eucalyptus grandis]|uniref:Uncharacterized protein n=2 Tax=Eucalyptus grandis TaxID=71139 RepID=A0ACC3KEY5_EUCGR|nr:hypothetical protein EUGRSUZ_F01574 [Eucalyptus grandis]
MDIDSFKVIRRLNLCRDRATSEQGQSDDDYVNLDNTYLFITSSIVLNIIFTIKLVDRYKIQESKNFVINYHIPRFNRCSKYDVTGFPIIVLIRVFD